jgi:hypothetical protein
MTIVKGCCLWVSYIWGGKTYSWSLYHLRIREEREKQRRGRVYHRKRREREIHTERVPYIM